MSAGPISGYETSRLRAAHSTGRLYSRSSRVGSIRRAMRSAISRRHTGSGVGMCLAVACWPSAPRTAPFAASSRVEIDRGCRYSWARTSTVRRESWLSDAPCSLSAPAPQCLPRSDDFCRASAGKGCGSSSSRTSPSGTQHGSTSIRTTGGSSRAVCPCCSTTRSASPTSRAGSSSRDACSTPDSAALITAVQRAPVR